METSAGVSSKDGKMSMQASERISTTTTAKRAV